MKIIWDKAPCSAGDIIQALVGKDRTWHPKTIKTYLTRLVNKQVLEFHRAGRAYVYTPLLTEKQCVDAASESFLGRVFGGSFKPMLAHFVEHKKLTAKEIRELKELLEKEGQK